MIDAATDKVEDISLKQDALELMDLPEEDRVIVENAKSILMRQRNLSEDETYRMLMTMAHQRRTSVVDLSKQLIATAKMLII